MKKLLLLVIALLVGGTAYAQENPRWELSADYSFARWNPSQGTVLNLHSLNGGGGSLVYNLTGFLGIKADLQGYGSQSNTFVFPDRKSITSGGRFHQCERQSVYVYLWPGGQASDAQSATIFPNTFWRGTQQCLSQPLQQRGPINRC